jgi:hypothetical protein
VAEETRDNFRVEFTAQTTRVRRELDHLLVGATEARLREPGAEGDWSCADVLAHFTGYTRGVADALRQARGEGPLAPAYQAPPGLGDDDFNAIVVGYWRKRSLVELLAEERSAFNALVEEVLRLPQVALETPGQFAFTKRSLLEILPNQIHKHYVDHMPALRRKLAPTPDVG